MAYESRVTQTHTSNGSTANSSKVTIKFQIRRTDYTMIGNNYTGSAYYNIKCDGQSTGNKYFNFDWNNTAQNTWWTVATATFTVPHNDDGTKKISYSGYYYTGISPSSFSASGSATLTTIPRYASITTFKVSSVGLLSASVNWTASNECDAVQYSLNGADFVDTSGETFSISGLRPATTYTLQIKVRRKDSQLWTTSEEISFTTLSTASISNSSISFDIGGTLNLTFKDYSNNASYLKLYAQDTTDTWTQIATVSNVQAASYSWNLSSYASAMYDLCPNSNTLNIKIICGVSLTSGGTTFTVESEKTGTAKVINSNPTFSTFTFLNTDSVTSNILGNTTSLIRTVGNLRIKITSGNKAIALNSATMKSYTIKITCGNNVLSKTATYSDGDISVDFGALVIAGTHTISVIATDSRGNSTSATEQTVIVYPYHTPTLTATFTRINRFETETLLNLKSLISRVIVDGTDKNSIQSLKYHYAETGTSYPETYIDITEYSTSTSNDDYVHTLVSTEDSPFTTFESNKTYNVELIVTDKISSYTLVVNVNQGIPGMAVMDNGKVLIRTVPNEENITDAKADVIVANDVKAKGIYLGESIEKLNDDIDILNNNLLEKVYPVGSIYMSVKSTNPGTLFGGTWTAWGSGKVPVGVDSNDTDFDTVENTGGEKTHTLTTDEMPSHTHNVTSVSNATYGTPSGNYHYLRGSATQKTTSSGGGAAHNNLQPYITCYMWKRIA